MMTTRSQVELAMPAVDRDEGSVAFFDAAARRQLMLQRCVDCGSFGPPDARVCSPCAGTNLEPAVAQGRGNVITWSQIHPHPAAGGEAPAVIAAYVELDEGPWLLVRLVVPDGEVIRSGLPVEVDFVEPRTHKEAGETAGETLPIFVAVDAAPRRPAGTC